MPRLYLIDATRDNIDDQILFSLSIPYDLLRRDHVREARAFVFISEQRRWGKSLIEAVKYHAAVIDQ